jgi:eukaryotic-like serine/threonine-protein kinase
VLGYHFFYRFPGGVPSGRLWNASLWFLYAGAAFSVGFIQVLRIHAAQGQAAVTRFIAEHTLMTAGSRVSGFIYSAAVVAMVAVIVRNYRLLSDADQRRRVRLVIYSSALGLTPLFLQGVFNLVRLFGGPAFSLGLNQQWVDGLTVAVPISVGYVVVKHRVFDIRVVLRLGVQYLLARRALQILLALPAAALAYTVVTSRNQTITEIVTERTGYVYWLAAAALSMKFRRSLRAWLDRKFFREQYDREQVLTNLLEELSRLNSPSEISRLVSTQVERAFHPKSIYLWYLNSDTVTLVYPADRGEVQVPSEGRLRTLFANNETLQLQSLGAEDILEENAEWFREREVSLIVPIFASRSGLLGALMLGEKKSEEPYSPSDRKLLQAVANQIAVVHENLELKERVSEEQRIRHDVLVHLDTGVLGLLKECPQCGSCFDGDADNCTRDGYSLKCTLPVPRTIDGRYRLDQLIGKGGMGAVYEARDLRLDRPVAIKMMVGRALAEEQSFRRFQREARAVAKLNHSKVVSVYDCGALGSQGAFLVMERVYGATLRAELNRVGRFQPDAAANLFEQVLEGVAAAHAVDIIHRDLKPENIICAPMDSGAVSVKILDFGLAKFRPLDTSEMATALTAPGVVLGTLGYMAPEQLSGSEVDQRADIFALGVILVEMLTGHRPFRSDSHAELLKSVLLDTYHLPGSSGEILALDGILQRCLAKQSKDRFPSVDALRQAVVPALRRCPPFSSGSAESRVTDDSSM